MTTKTIEFTETLEMVTTTCRACGCVFGAAKAFMAQRRKDGGWFYCPSGHQQHFSETEAQRLQRELDTARDALAASRNHAASVSSTLDRERKSHASTKGQLTKTRKRVLAGVCPDCNRHFVNVERHMASQHDGPGERIKPTRRPLPV